MSILDEIRDIVGADSLLQSADIERASSYWDSSPTQAMALVKPCNTEQVAEILKVCNQYQ